MRPLSTRIVSLHILLVSHSVGYYWLKRDFCASDFDTIAFSYVSLRIETVFPREKKQIYRACRDSSKRRNQLLLLWSGAAKRRAEALRRAQDPSVRAHADCLWSGGEEACRVRYCRVNLS